MALIEHGEVSPNLWLAYMSSLLVLVISTIVFCHEAEAFIDGGFVFVLSAVLLSSPKNFSFPNISVPKGKNEFLLFLAWIIAMVARFYNQ